VERVLELTAHLPPRDLHDGEVLISEGDAPSTVIVLVQGELVVEAGGVVLNRHVRPGTIVGETSALLGQPRNATVTAGPDTVVRVLDDAEAALRADPELLLEVARQLAGRLDRLATYISEVQRLYGDRTDHLGVFGQLLERIASTPAVDIEGGSDRAPD
jgi:CRP-like cAMP-binding protein